MDERSDNKLRVGRGGEEVKPFCQMQIFFFTWTDDPQTVLMTNPYRVTEMKTFLLRQCELLR